MPRNHNDSLKVTLLSVNSTTPISIIWRIQSAKNRVKDNHSALFFSTKKRRKANPYARLKNNTSDQTIGNISETKLPKDMPLRIPECT